MEVDYLIVQQSNKNTRSNEMILNECDSVVQIKSPPNLNGIDRLKNQQRSIRIYEQKMAGIKMRRFAKSIAPGGQGTQLNDQPLFQVNVTESDLSPSQPLNLGKKQLYGDLPLHSTKNQHYTLRVSRSNVGKDTRKSMEYV